MSYRVKYWKQEPKRRHSDFFILLLFWYAFFLFVVNSFWQPGAQKLREYLYMEKMTSALEVFEANLRDGEALPVAVNGFVNEILG